MRRAVNSMPALLTAPDGDKQNRPTLGDVPQDLESFKERVREIAEGMEAKTWKAAREDLLKLAGATVKN
jgi:hypothetical protein